jgi:HSP20 family protein
MEIVRYIPHNFFTQNIAPFSRLFDDFFAPSARSREWSKGAEILPSVDIYEKENKIYVNAELPGVAKEDIRVDVKGRLLIIKGESKNDTEVKEENNYRRERRYGRLERTFNLAFEIDPDSIEAKYENGVLSLVIPRPEEQKPKQVVIH